MRRDASVLWVYALVAALMATVSVARGAPDPDRATAAVPSRAATDLRPDDGRIRLP